MRPYIPSKGDLVRELDAVAGGRATTGAAGEGGKRAEGGAQPWTLREFGLGAQVLADLGVHQIRLLTNSQLKIAGLAGFGLKVVEQVPLVSMNGEGR